MSRIILEVPPEVHNQIKAMASLRGETIKDYVLKKVLPVKEKIPNKETLKAMQNILEKKNIVEHDNLDELFKDLGI